jgi:lactoylglutathione lyase
MKLGYTILFVPSVTDAVSFYEQTFGLSHTSLNAGFATLDTGETTLAFGWEENEQRELGATTFRPNRAEMEPAGVQISFITDDVQSAYDRAIRAGATEVYGPRQMPWGQTVSRVRDLNGVLVSIVTAPRL